MKKLLCMVIMLVCLMQAVLVSAAQIRVFVSDVNAIGVQNRDEMRQTMQALLAAKLNNEQIMSVAAAAEADLIVTGTYIQIGKLYSLDALAKTTGGRTVARSHVQGNATEGVMSAAGALADKLAKDIPKAFTAPAAVVAVPAVAPAMAPASQDFIPRSQVVRRAPQSDFIKPREYEKAGPRGWLSKRLEAAYNLLAMGSKQPNGSRNIFMAENRKVAYFVQGEAMKFYDEFEVRMNEKIISLDVLPSKDGNDLIFVTIVRDAEPCSQVWQLKGTRMVRLADNVDWLMRVASLGGGEPKLYVQGAGRDDIYYGDVYEAEFKGKSIVTKKAIPMPRFGNVYNYNTFKDAQGQQHHVIINPDNYLVVFDSAQKELWRSNDAFGGSELYFQKQDLVNTVENSGNYKWFFMNQKIQVTSKGDILVGKNEGFFVIGVSRTYKKGSVYNFEWTGSSLEEKWRTRDTQSYMPDFMYDEAANELLILQMTQRDNLANKGASSLAIKKVE